MRQIYYYIKLKGTLFMAKIKNSDDIGINRLKNIMAQLRDPLNGCPWDLKQTYKSIAPYTVEEAYEVEDAIERGDMADLREELGDLLLQVVYLSEIAAEDKYFDFDDVVETISLKMEQRHPNIFCSDKPQDKKPDWEALKEKERKKKNTFAGVLDGIANTLPPLVRATKLQMRAARVGFDWPDHEGAFEKLNEEISELKVEIDAPARNLTKLKDELGDVLFSVVNVARKLGVSPDECLKLGNLKFRNRFEKIEKMLKKEQRTFKETSLADLEDLWIKAKEKQNIENN